MRKLVWLLPAIALCAAPPASHAQFGQPYGPRFGGPHIPGFPDVGDPFGRPSGLPSIPGQSDPFGPARSPFPGGPGSGPLGEPPEPALHPGAKYRASGIPAEQQSRPADHAVERFRSSRERREGS